MIDSFPLYKFIGSEARRLHACSVNIFIKVLWYIQTAQQFTICTGLIVLNFTTTVATGSKRYGTPVSCIRCPISLHEQQELFILVALQRIYTDTTIYTLGVTASSERKTTNSYQSPYAIPLSTIILVCSTRWQVNLPLTTM